MQQNGRLVTKTRLKMINVETINIIWKTFDEAIPDRNVWIYVTPPKGGFLEADHTTLMPNINNTEETIKDGYQFYHNRVPRYLKSCGKWKWCYASDIISTLRNG